MDWEKDSLLPKEKLHTQAKQNKEFLYHFPLAGWHSATPRKADSQETRFPSHLTLT